MKNNIAALEISCLFVLIHLPLVNVFFPSFVFYLMDRFSPNWVATIETILVLIGLLTVCYIIVASKLIKQKVLWMLFVLLIPLVGEITFFWLKIFRRRC